MKKEKTSKGFTLIELIVVIAMILVLSGFLVPKYAGYQAKAKETKAINTAKQIQTAAMSSYSEMEDKFVSEGVTNTVTLLTSAESASAVVTGDGKSVTVKYKSDSSDYNAVITDGSDFKVYKGTDATATNQIFPKK